MRMWVKQLLIVFYFSLNPDADDRLQARGHRSFFAPVADVRNASCSRGTEASERT
jgi:hypothetical protein